MAAQPASQPSSLRQALAVFSPVTPLGCTVQGCPRVAGAMTVFTEHAAPDKPCNLQKLEVIEPAGKPLRKDGARIADFLRTPERVRAACPVLLRSGTDTLQITGHSERQQRRQLNVNAIHQAWCGDPAHKRLRVVGPGLNKEFDGGTASFGLSRTALPTDDGFQDGLWAFINFCYQPDFQPQVYEVHSAACGLPPDARSTPNATLLASIQVYPADEFELKLEIPALKQPESCKYESNEGAWRTSEEVHADSYYQSEKAFLREQGISRHDVRKFVADMAKKESGEDDQKFADDITFEFSHTDDRRVTKAPIHDVVKLVRFLREAEHRAAQISDWINGAQIGLGASFSISCQFFAGSISGKWGFVESLDDRVFYAMEAKLDIDVVKLELKISAGWRCAGLADLFVEFGGAGTLGLSIAVAQRGPDGGIKPSVSPKGELVLTGAIKRSLMWAIKGETGLECTLTPNYENFYFMRDGKALSGYIEIERGAIYKTVTYSCRVFGGTSEKEELRGEDKHFGRIPMPD